MAALLTDALKQVAALDKTDDDVVDRLNHRSTIILLITFAAFVSAKQFVGAPISCWVPKQYGGSQVAYTNSICWLKGTYYLERDKQIVPHHTENTEFRIAYYQFVPYVLFVMAILFYLPHAVWRSISRYIGFDLPKIIGNVKNLSKIDIDQAATQLHVTLQYNAYKYYKSSRLFESIKCFHRYRRLAYIISSHRLTLLYIFVKIFYLINCLCQFYFLSNFLSFPFYKFGIDWLSTTLNKVQTKVNTQSDESKWFPRNVMCDFMVRHLGSNHHWISVQCNLPINLFNELIFLILWTWLIFLTGLTCVSFLISLFTIYTNISRKLIHKYLHMASFESDKEMNEFIENYLQYDGILVLRIIAYNTNDTIMVNLVKSMFNNYLNIIEREKKNNLYDQIELNGLYAHIEGTSI